MSPFPVVSAAYRYFDNIGVLSTLPSTSLGFGVFHPPPDVVGNVGIEPTAPSFQARMSANDLISVVSLIS